ncbi:hypothetical protein [Nonomuraea guangzhouensis]|uniref:Uncharacterized protein n=1 Tax=Nonomuraea guangzhouensis TaxID=1291555 RepID=A0ABW4G3K2_9ACTN|nr:hypothetical protein [Nonomuraea guangzhouensis]
MTDQSTFVGCRVGPAAAKGAFVRQLNEQSGPQAAGAVQRVLEHWPVRTAFQRAG